MAQKLQIIIDVEGDAAKDLKVLRSEVTDLDDDLHQVGQGAQSARGDFDSLSSTVAHAAAAVGSMELLRAEVELIRVGAAAERARSGLNALTEGRADEYLRSVQEETEGTISQMEAIQTTSKLVGFGFAETEAEAAEFVRTAQILGGTFQGIGAAQAAEEMALLMANMSVARADTFGISAGDLRSRIDELMEATEGLNREAAFQQAWMELATERANDLEESFGGMQTEIEQLETTIADAKVEVGTLLSKGLLPYFEIMEALNDVTNDAITITSVWTNAQKALETAYNQNKDMATMMAIAGIEFIARMEHEIETNYDRAVALDMTTDEIWEQVRALGEAGEETGRAAEETEEQLSVQDELAQAFLDGELALEDYRGALVDLRSPAQEAAAVIRDLEAAEKEAARAAEGARRTMDDLTSFVATDASDEWRDFTSVIDDLGIAFSREEMDRFGLMLGGITQEQIKQRDLYFEMRDAAQTYGDSFTEEDFINIFTAIREGALDVAADMLESEELQATIDGFVGQLEQDMPRGTQTMRAAAEDDIGGMIESMDPFEQTMVGVHGVINDEMPTAMGTMAAAAEESLGRTLDALDPVAGRTEDLAKVWGWFQQNSALDLEVMMTLHQQGFMGAAAPPPGAGGVGVGPDPWLLSAGEFASGGSFVATQPTHFLAGEIPEMISVTPLSQMGGSTPGGGQTVVNFTYAPAVSTASQADFEAAIQPFVQTAIDAINGGAA